MVSPLSCSLLPSHIFYTSNNLFTSYWCSQTSIMLYLHCKIYWTCLDKCSSSLGTWNCPFGKHTSKHMQRKHCCSIGQHDHVSHCLVQFDKSGGWDICHMWWDANCNHLYIPTCQFLQLDLKIQVDLLSRLADLTVALKFKVN